MQRSVWLASFLLSQSLPAAAGVCDDLAFSIRQGQGSSLSELARSSAGAIQIAEELRGRAIPKQDLPPDFDNPSMSRLGKDGAVVVISTQGSMHCETPAFFDKRGSQVARVDGPSTLSSDSSAYCWDSHLEIASINNVPALVAETDGDLKLSLEVTSWADHRWGKTCRVDATFSSGLLVDEAYLGADAPAVLASQAVALAEQYRSGGPGKVAVTATERRLLAMRSALPKAGEIPTFGKSSSNPYTVFSAEKPMTVVVNGEPLLALVGGGSFGWRDYRGYLVAFWREKNGQLAPVASYQIKLGNGPLLSVKVTPDVKPKSAPGPKAR